MLAHTYTKTGTITSSGITDKGLVAPAYTDYAQGYCGFPRSTMENKELMPPDNLNILAFQTQDPQARASRAGLLAVVLGWIYFCLEVGGCQNDL
jgi:hypothetical protein